MVATGLDVDTLRWDGYYLRRTSARPYRDRMQDPAVEGFSDSLRMELKPFGIAVVLVQPAAIVTEWNTIARDSLLEHSGETAYGRYAKRAHQVLTEADREGGPMANGPEVVGRKIARIATVTRPPARYLVGRGARLATKGRDYLPDAVFDQIISRTFGSR